ncbi:MAG: M15 family metallopeptidase [Paracoccaceae bacterium]
MRALAAALALALWAAGALADCVATDWRAVPLPASTDPAATALETAYPGLEADRTTGTLTLPDGASLPFEPPRDVSPADRLDDATVGDQFTYTYPLAFDLDARRTPWQDPGRLRNDAFFRALWFDSARATRQSLTTVAYTGQTRTTRFQVTTKHCVHAQLAAALDAIAAMGPAFDVYFEKSGGSFNWRTIAGTDRLSVHSFGIAVDLNTDLGGYWRWSGATPGAVAAYDNRMPEPLVAAFERYGFIWGGKWHHFDGMHFEYRPELILYSRLAG